jgi:predicted PurR-regulated permease PerM
MDDRSSLIDLSGSNLTATERLERARAEASLPSVTQRVTTRIELPYKTIAKVIVTLAVLWLLARLWTILLLVFIAILLAAAINPVVRRLQRAGLPRTGAVAIVFIAILGVAAGILLLLIPPLIDEGRQLAADLPSYAERAQGILKDNPDLYQRIQDAANRGSADPGIVFSGFLAFGSGLISAISNGLIVLVLTVYILVDGERIYAWCVRYLPDKQEQKLTRAVPEVSKVVSGYVVGQLITSALFGIFTFVLLAALGVPQPLFLAIMAAFADAIPIAGVFIATVPAVLLAATVSWEAASITLVAYITYQQVENYLIVPRVYQKSLNVSSFAVLIAVLIGGQLLGIIGVLMALPIAAVIPAIEKIWIEEEGGPIGTEQWREEMAKAEAEAEEAVGDDTAGQV